jgi:hypothetical protein
MTVRSHPVPPFLSSVAGVGLSLTIALASLWPACDSALARRAPSVPATAARTVSLSETGRLQLTHKHDFTLYERGSASGTIAGTIYVRLTAVSSSRVVVAVSIYPRGGSISGSGSGRYRRSGTTASFSGSMSFGGGTGRYKGAHGSQLSFSGTIQESHSDAITVYVRGKISD